MKLFPIYIFLIGLCLGIAVGAFIQHIPMQASIYQCESKLADANSLAANADMWRWKANQAEPMINQWRTGYEQLKEIHERLVDLYTKTPAPQPHSQTKK